MIKLALGLCLLPILVRGYGHFQNPKVGLSLTREEFTTASKVLLGLPFFSSQSCNLRCICGHVLDKYLYHLLGCGRRSLHTKRYNALRGVLFQYLISDNSDCKVEQGCSSNNFKKPGNLFHPDFLDGRSSFFDIKVRNSLLPRFIAIAATHPGQAADAGERGKELKHDDDVLQDFSQSLLLAVEILGLWSPQSLETLKVIAMRAVYQRKITTSQSVCQLHEQLSVFL